MEKEKQYFKTQITRNGLDLIVKDMSARIAYGVMVSDVHMDGDVLTSPYKLWDIIIDDWYDENFDNYQMCYLRPMSSMTKKEKEEFEKTCFFSNEIGTIQTIESADWLNAHHFDYRGLIELGLAFKAPKDMYKFE